MCHFEPDSCMDMSEISQHSLVTQWTVIFHLQVIFLIICVFYENIPFQRTIKIRACPCVILTFMEDFTYHNQFIRANGIRNGHSPSSLLSWPVYFKWVIKYPAKAFIRLNFFIFCHATSTNPIVFYLLMYKHKVTHKEEVVEKSDMISKDFYKGIWSVWQKFTAACHFGYVSLSLLQLYKGNFAPFFAKNGSSFTILDGDCEYCSSSISAGLSYLVISLSHSNMHEYAVI